MSLKVLFAAGAALAVLAIGPQVVATEVVDGMSSIAAAARSTSTSSTTTGAPTLPTPHQTDDVPASSSKKATPVSKKPAPTTKKPRHQDVDATDRAPEDNVEFQTGCDDNGKPYDVIPNNAVTRRAAAKMCANIQKSIDAAGWGN